MKIIRLPDVKTQLGHPSHTTVYDAINEGLFPPGVPIGKRAKGWPEDEVSAINAARIAGKSEAEIRALVKRLLARRLELATE